MQCAIVQNTIKTTFNAYMHFQQERNQIVLKSNKGQKGDAYKDCETIFLVIALLSEGILEVWFYVKYFND